MELTFLSASPRTHHQLVLVSGRPDTSDFNPINQISLMVDPQANLREVHRQALGNGASEIRVVLHGNAWPFYFKDPEGNVVEAYLDTSVHVPKPHCKALSLRNSDAEILKKAEAVCRADPGFMMMEHLRKPLEKRLSA